LMIHENYYSISRRSATGIQCSSSGGNHDGHARIWWEEQKKTPKSLYRSQQKASPGINSKEKHSRNKKGYQRKAPSQPYLHLGDKRWSGGVVKVGNHCLIRSIPGVVVRAVNISKNTV